MENKLPERKRTRMKYFDYSRNGAYFITICTQDRKKILADNMLVGDGVLDIPKMRLTEYGKIVEKNIKLIEKAKGVYVDKYVVMPNHIHLIIAIRNDVVENGMSRTPSPTNAIIPHVISTFKRFCNKEIGKKIFQRSFHDHIIRNSDDYDKISRYIYENPLIWEKDCFYSEE